MLIHLPNGNAWPGNIQPSHVLASRVAGLQDCATSPSHKRIEQVNCGQKTKRRALKGRASKGQTVKGIWEMSGIRIDQGYRTAIVLQRTVHGNIEGGKVKGGDTGAVL